MAEEKVVTLDSAVNDAAKQLEKEITDKGGKIPAKVEAADEEETDEEKVEESVEGDEEEEEETPADLTDDEVDQAKRFFKALKDPEVAPQIIAALAQKAGLLGKNTPETKAEVKEAKKALGEILKESLGETYGFLAGPLEKVFEKVLADEREERQTEIAKLTSVNRENEVDKVLSDLARDTKGDSRKHENAMLRLMDDLKPAEGVSIKTYLNQLYTLATAGKTVGSTKAAINDKIKRNANDAASRLQSTGGSSKSTSAVVPDKKMGLSESVNWALEQMKNSK